MKVKFKMHARKIGAIGISYPVELEVSGVDLEAFSSDDWRARGPELHTVFQAFEFAGWDWLPGAVLLVEVAGEG